MITEICIFNVITVMLAPVEKNCPLLFFNSIITISVFSLISIVYKAVLRLTNAMQSLFLVRNDNTL